MRYYPAPESAIMMPDLIEAVRDVFIDHGNGNCEMPPKTYITLPGGDFRTMPSYLPGLQIAGVKVVNVHPDNFAKGLPTVMGIIILLDPPTGKPVAILNGTALTDLRTGATTGVATDALSSKKKGTVGIIGAGRQARSGLLAISEVFQVESVRVWSRNEKTATRFAEQFPDMNVTITSLEQASDATVLLTTTPSTKPLINDEWVAEGTHINAIGADAPGKQELDPNLLSRSQIFVDDREQAIHSGEVNVPIHDGLLSPEDITGTLGEVLIGKVRRKDPESVTIFDSTGIAITDLAAASVALQKGTFIELPFEPGF